MKSDVRAYLLGFLQRFAIVDISITSVERTGLVWYLPTTEQFEIYPGFIYFIFNVCRYNSTHLFCNTSQRALLATTDRHEITRHSISGRSGNAKHGGEDGVSILLALRALPGFTENSHPFSAKTTNLIVLTDNMLVLYGGSPRRSHDAVLYRRRNLDMPHFHRRGTLSVYAATVLNCAPNFQDARFSELIFVGPDDGACFQLFCPHKR